MINVPDQLDTANTINKHPLYHPPVMVEYGSARNLTRTGFATFLPDGGFIDDAIDLDGGAGRAS